MAVPRTFSVKIKQKRSKVERQQNPYEQKNIERKPINKK
jgi:hypothetical protein